MTDTGFTFTQTAPINSTIPKVKCRFTANHLVYDRPDQLAVIVAKIELVASSPVYDDTFATVYGFPIEQTAADVNTVVTFPLQATTDSLNQGRYLKQVNGNPVQYKLTVTARETGQSQTDIILVNGVTFHVDAEDVDDTFIIAMAAAQDRPFLPSLTATAKQHIDTYIAELVALGALVYDGVSYPHLVDTDTGSADAINAAFAAGHIGFGDIVRTGAYHQGSDVGGGTYRVVAAATGTADGGSFIDFTGFQLAAIFADGTIAVEQFGTKGDGTTDDLAALTAATTASVNHSGRMTIGAGTFMVSAPWELPGRVNLTGSKATIIKASAAMNYVVGNTAIGWDLPNQRFYMTKINVDGNGLAVAGMEWTFLIGTSAVDHCSATGATGPGFRFIKCQVANFARLRADGNGTHGFHVTDCNASSFANLSAVLNGSSGIRVDVTGDPGYVGGCDLVNPHCEGNGVTAASPSIAVVGVQYSLVRISGGWLEEDTINHHGVEIDNSWVDMQGTHITGGGADTTKWAVHVTGAAPVANVEFVFLARGVAGHADWGQIVDSSSNGGVNNRLGPWINEAGGRQPRSGEVRVLPATFGATPINDSDGTVHTFTADLTENAFYELDNMPAGFGAMLAVGLTMHVEYRINSAPTVDVYSLEAGIVNDLGNTVLAGETSTTYVSVDAAVTSTTYQVATFSFDGRFVRSLSTASEWGLSVVRLSQIFQDNAGADGCAIQVRRVWFTGIYTT